MEHDKLNEIYQKYYKDVYLYAFSLCKDAHLTEEIVSDTFYKAFLAIEVDGNSIKFWLFRVCKNCFIDRQRRSKWHDSRPMEELRDLSSKEMGPLDYILKEENYRRLYLAILKLPDIYQEVVLLFYFQNFSIVEISRLLKKNSGAIRMALHRARQRLKEIMEEDK